MSPAGAGPALTLRPWRALRFEAARVTDLARVTAPPYDSVEPHELRAEVARDPHNIVRLTIPEIDPHDPLLPDVHPHEHAGALLQAWVDEGVLVEDDADGLYVYEYTDGPTQVRGVVGVADLTTPGTILPHEAVLPAAVTDRTALLRSAHADLEPLVLIPDSPEPLADALEGCLRSLAPDAWTTVVLGDGEVHRWARVPHACVDRLRAAVAVGPALLADGHHRFAAHQRLLAECGEADQEARRSWGQALSIVVDQSRHPMRVDPVHRVFPHVDLSEVPAPDGWTAAPVAPDAPVRPDEVRVVVGDRHWSWERAGDDPRSTVELLHDELLPALALSESWFPVLTDADLALEHARATQGSAILLTATPLRRVLDQAGRGISMPAKSTAFSPKPRTGVLMRRYAHPRSEQALAPTTVSAARPSGARGD